MATTLQIVDTQGAAAAAVELNESWLERERGAQAVKDSVVAYLAGIRSGSASTKNKAAVAGSSAKPWRQKGTGRARAGTRKSPLWRGGGVVFGPLPRSYAKRVNRKVQQLALRRAFTDRVDAGEVIVVSEVSLDEAKTSKMVEFLMRIGAGQDTLLLVDELSANVAMATRNLPCVHVMRASSVNTYLLLLFRKIVFSRAGIEAFGKRLAP
jgi:large subunit ribosomal protein L4